MPGATIRRLSWAALAALATGACGGGSPTADLAGSSSSARPDSADSSETANPSATGPSTSTSSGTETGTETRGSSGDPEPVDWRLEAGHFYPAVMEPVAIYPRPDDEVEAWARHRWAHPDIEYRIPAAVVQGGAWPFRYEVIEGPPGATVGQTLHWENDRMVADADYGVLSWTPGRDDEGSTFAFQVRVTDQEGTMLDVHWTTTVDSSRFVFVSPRGDDDAAGTIDAPLQTVQGWYRDDPDDDRYAGRLVYFRAGTYVPRGSPSNDDNLRMEVARKPMTLMGVPGETVVFDSTRANWTFWDGTDDVYIAGIHFSGSKLEQPDGTPLRNARTIAFYGTANHDRITLFEVEATAIRPGNPVDELFGNDNPAFVWRPSSGAQRGHHWAFVGNRFDEAGPRRPNGPSCVSLSNVSYVVYEHNEVSRWEGTHTFFDKANNDHVTQRNNDLWRLSRPGSLIGGGLGASLSDSYDPDHHPGYFETCWNRVRTDDEGVNETAVEYGGSFPDLSGPVWIYRNSLRGNVQISGPLDLVADRNVLQGGYQRDAEAPFVAGDNLVEPDLSSTVFDDEGWLAPPAQFDPGTHGADVR